MKTSSRTTFLLSAVAAALAWTTLSVPVSGKSATGIYVTRNGFRTPVYGTSVHKDADGSAVTECARLMQPQVDAERIGRRLSGAMRAISPQSVVSTTGGGSFEVTYTDAQGTGFNDTANGATRRRALEAAVSSWSKVIKTTVQISIEASMHDMEDTDNDPNTMVLATASPTEFWVIDGKGLPSSLTWQKLDGKYSNAADSDITVNVNQLADFNYALNGVVPRGETSFVYTLMHEIGHGLGITDSFDYDTGLPLNDPLIFIFDGFVNRGSARTNRVADHAAEERKRDMVSNDLFFNGPAATEASAKSITPRPMVKLYAPNPFEPGSSIAHVDQTLYADIRTGLMAPIDFGAGTDKIDILTQGIIKDLGYTMVPNAPAPSPTLTSTRVHQ